MSSIGFLNASRLRGRSLEFLGDPVEIVAAVHAQVGALGKYRRSRPLKFSLVPR